MRNKFSSWILWSLMPLFETASQIFLKMASEGPAEAGSAWLAHALSSPYFMLSLGCDAGSFAVWIVILRYTYVGIAFPISSVCFITVLASSWFVFHEPVHLSQVVGCVLIMTGALLLGLPKTKEPQ